ncbi:MAG: adenylate/guanylate cyclase domain-containing protein [Saprospiraceae bacterium]|nr:adenylate/guanylate cyclase domain-containing protein [Saprospiraceae bacterium]
MKLTIWQKRNLITGLKLTGSSILIALIYAVFSDGFAEWLPFFNAFLIGLVGGGIISFLELDVFVRKGSDLPFILKFALRTFIYVVLFVSLVPLIVLVNESVYYERTLREHYYSEHFQSFLYREDFEIILIYILVFIAIIIFTRLMNQKLGQGVLWNYITGNYYKPREENRIFMFVDLRSSTRIAEGMTNLQYHRFIKDFFKDLTEPILRHGGIIYQYVGDQVRVTWKWQKPNTNADCLRAYHNIKSALHSRREHYLDAYGIVPEFSTSVHCGKVISGELGDVKSQIVFMGDTIVELSVIEKCFGQHELKEPILLSDRLLEYVQLPALFNAEPVCNIKLSGKRFELFTLRERSSRSFAVDYSS